MNEIVKYSSKGTIKLGLRDLELFKNALSLFNQGNYDVIQFSCYNRAEADAYKEWWQQNYPEIQVHVKWMTIRDSKTGIIYE